MQKNRLDLSMQGGAISKGSMELIITVRATGDFSLPHLSLLSRYLCSTFSETFMGTPKNFLPEGCNLTAHYSDIGLGHSGNGADCVVGEEAAE